MLIFQSQTIYKEWMNCSMRKGPLWAPNENSDQSSKKSDQVLSKAPDKAFFYSINIDI